MPVAARRLLIVMLVLLAMSTVAAALAPPPSRDEATSTTSTTSAADNVKTGGELVKAKLDAQASRPQTIRIPLGDQLALTVSSKRAGQVQIAGLGLVDDVAPLSPARFDVFADHPGRYEIRFSEPAASGKPAGGPQRGLGEIVLVDR